MGVGTIGNYLSSFVTYISYKLVLNMLRATTGKTCVKKGVVGLQVLTIVGLHNENPCWKGKAECGVVAKPYRDFQP